jgi:hypothetical protein
VTTELSQAIRVFSSSSILISSCPLIKRARKKSSSKLISFYQHSHSKFAALPCGGAESSNVIDHDIELKLTTTLLRKQLPLFVQRRNHPSMPLAPALANLRSKHKRQHGNAQSGQRINSLRNYSADNRFAFSLLLHQLSLSLRTKITGHVSKARTNSTDTSHLTKLGISSANALANILTISNFTLLANHQTAVPEEISFDLLGPSNRRYCYHRSAAVSAGCPNNTSALNKRANSCKYCYLADVIRVAQWKRSYTIKNLCQGVRNGFSGKTFDHSF